jgi:subtilisin family serine protease
MPRTDSASISPATFDEVITVSGMADFDGVAGGRGRQPACMTNDKDDTFWDESNYGSDVDLVAPAVCITTTSASMWTGTSFAAPHVAGAAALYKVARPTASPAEVKHALLAAAQSGWNVSRSAGRPHGDDPDSTPEPLLNLQPVQRKRSASTAHAPRSSMTTIAAEPGARQALWFQP